MMDSLPLNKNIDWFDNVDPRLLSTLYFRHIYKRIHTYKFNFLGMFTGKHRVGKSTSSISVAHALDPTFLPNLEERVVYFPDDFMRALQDIKRKRIIGGAIVWDEAGVGIPAREWYDTSNKSISYTLQVFGRYRPIVFFVTQDVGYIDSQARKLFHGFYEMNRIGNKFASAKTFDVKYNKRTGKVYYIYPRHHMKNGDAFGCKVIIKKINVLLPFKEMLDRYEFHSKIFKDKIVEQMQERSENYNQGKVDTKRMTMDEITNTLVNHKDDKLYLSKRSKDDNVIFDKDAIRQEFDITDSLARHIKKVAELRVNEDTNYEVKVGDEVD